MSEAESGPGRGEEDSPVTEKVDAVPARLIKEERRSSSADTVGTGGDHVELFSICYSGKTLRLPTSQPHMYQVIYRILKQVYLPLVPQILVGLPKGWTEVILDHNQVAECAKKYNMAAKPYAKNWGGSYNTDTLREWGHPQCTFRVARDIVNFAYECAVPRPSDLNNHYKSFSSETYGETNLEQMASIIDELRLGPSDVFVDLGSGIGQLVCFTSAYTKIKKAVGIELSPLPAGHAVDLSNYFKKIMAHFGKNCGKFELIEGDFLNPKFKKLITEEATVIFINNYAFGPDLMFNITNELLQELKHGTRIVTTKPFGSNKREITYRSTSDITAMSDTVQMRSVEHCVSWTANKVDFWLTTMDHTKLIKYYEDELHKKKQQREGSEAVEQHREHGNKKRKTERDSNGHKIKTEAAASHQEPKWDDPDTEYTPPVKKSKKHRETGEVALLREPSSTTTSIKKKKEKAPSVSKTPKPPKSSRNYSVEPTSTTPRASQPKATAPPPNHATLCQPKIEEPSEPDQSLAHPHLDAKTLSAIHTIREAASSSTPTQAAAIQDAINSVLSQPEQSPAEPQTNSTVSQPPPPAPAMQFGGTASATSSLPAPIAVYPPAAPIVAPPPPPPPISQNVIPPSAELATEQRHTFMIPPTDPMYDMIVTFYFGFKGVSNQAKTGDIELINQLRADIENEKAKKNELTESITSTTGQIDDLLASGVGILKNRLDDLGMPGVSDVTELLAGSKHIVTQHKTLTTMVAQLQNAVAIEEQKLAMLGGPDAVKCFDDALIANNMDINKLSEIMISSRPSNFVAQILPDDIGIASDSKVSPSSRRPRQNKPRQNAASGGKRGGAFSGRKTEGFNEDEELEIQQFVQHALKVDNAVKEKERKARGNSLVAAERVARKDFTGAAPPPATSNSLLHH